MVTHLLYRILSAGRVPLGVLVLVMLKLVNEFRWPLLIAFFPISLSSMVWPIRNAALLTFSSIYHKVVIPPPPFDVFFYGCQLGLDCIGELELNWGYLVTLRRGTFRKGRRGVLTSAL